MGTRADFYVGRGTTAEWLGSIAFDGYLGGIVPKSDHKEPWPGDWEDEPFAEGEHLFDATDEAQFRARLARYFERRTDVTLPEQGWPWPWENSNTTDFAYAFDEGQVWGTCFGHGWWPANEYSPDREDDAAKISDWPDMSDRTRVALGPRSGMILVTSP